MTKICGFHVCENNSHHFLHYSYTLFIYKVLSSRFVFSWIFYLINNQPLSCDNAGLFADNEWLSIDLWYFHFGPQGSSFYHKVPPNGVLDAKFQTAHVCAK